MNAVRFADIHRIDLTWSDGRIEAFDPDGKQAGSLDLDDLGQFAADQLAKAIAQGARVCALIVDVLADDVHSGSARIARTALNN